MVQRSERGAIQRSVPVLSSWSGRISRRCLTGLPASNAPFQTIAARQLATRAVTGWAAPRSRMFESGSAWLGILKVSAPEQIPAGRSKSRPHPYFADDRLSHAATKIRTAALDALAANRPNRHPTGVIAPRRPRPIRCDSG